MGTIAIAPQGNLEEKFVSFLSHVGHFFKVALDKALPFAAAAEPIVGIAFPQLSGLYDSTVAAVAMAEQKAAAAAQQDGSGAQKLADVLAVIAPVATQQLSQAGVKVNSEQLTKYVNAVVASLNALPAPGVR